MKKCATCGFENEDTATVCINCGQKFEEQDNSELEYLKRKARKSMIPLLFWLFPTVLTAVYGLLVELGILPIWIKIFGVRIDFNQLFWNIPMTIIGIVGFVVFPIIYLIFLIDRIDTRREVKRMDEMANRQTSSSFQSSFEEIETYGEYRPDDIKVEMDEPTTQVVFRRAKAIDRDTYLDSRYSDGVSLDEMANAIDGAMKANGISVPKECLRVILSAMSASRLLWVTGQNKTVIHRVFEVLSKYFGTTLIVDNAAGVGSAEMLAVRGNVGEIRMESEFFINTYLGHCSNKGVFFAALDNVNKEFLDKCFTEYLESASSSGRQYYATVPYVSDIGAPKHIVGGRFEIPNNIWYVLIAAEGTGAFDRPEDAIPVDLSSVKECEKDHTADVPERKPVSKVCLENEARKARQNNFIPEEYWKKIDMLEDYIAQRVSGYSLDNKSVRKIESFVGVYMYFGGTMYEAIDYFVSAKMLPRLKGCEKSEISGDENGLASALDRIFGLDNMPFSLECARKLGAV